MSWEYRNGTPYYYRKRRIGQYVISQYLGNGPRAKLTSILDQQRREHWQAIRSQRRTKKTEIAALDHQVAALSQATRAILSATLLVSGFHRHRGQWRRIRMDHEIVAHVNPGKTAREKAGLGAREAADFAAVVGRTCGKKPGPNDLEELRQWLADYPVLWRGVFDLAESVKANIVRCIVVDAAGQLGLEANVSCLATDLGYEAAPALEQLLIQNIVVAWLHLQWAEHQSIRLMGPGTVSMHLVEFWDRRLSACQRRYLAACEALARARKLAAKNPTLQVNIAAQGGQQVNVAGDLPGRN